MSKGHLLEEFIFFHREIEQHDALVDGVFFRQAEKFLAVLLVDMR